MFTAYSLVIEEPEKAIAIDESLHRPIVQELGVLARSPHKDAAQSFTAFMLSGAGRGILERYGYKIH